MDYLTEILDFTFDHWACKWEKLGLGLALVWVGLQAIIWARPKINYSYVEAQPQAVPGRVGWPENKLQQQSQHKQKNKETPA